MQMEASPDEDDEVTLEIKSDTQLILSALCETDMHRKVKLSPSFVFNYESTLNSLVTMRFASELSFRLVLVG